jgi:ferredoxin
MRKGEKLYQYIDKYIHDHGFTPMAFAHMITDIKNMSDEEFDEIIKPELDKNEILCTLCKNVTWCNPKFPMDKEEMENYICSSCEEAVNEKRFY